jgi:ABC-type transport system substrate-binding protein
VQAGHANGLKLDGIAPFPPYYEMAERLATDLKAAGIRVPVQTMDQPAFRSKMGKGKDGWPGGRTIVHEIVVAPGNAAAEIETVATCASSASFICEPYIEERWAKHQASINPAERSRLVQEIQRYVIAEYLAVPLYINPFVHAVGPRVLPEGDAPDWRWCSGAAMRAWCGGSAVAPGARLRAPGGGEWGEYVQYYPAPSAAQCAQYRHGVLHPYCWSGHYR